MSQDGVRSQHLGHSYGTTPADITSVTYFELSSLMITQRGKSHEILDLFLIIDKQWLEIPPVTEPKEAPEFLFESKSDLF